MATPVPITDEILSPRRQWMLHLWSLVLPLTNLAFLTTGPHGPVGALLWILPIVMLVIITTDGETRSNRSIVARSIWARPPLGPLAFGLPSERNWSST